MRATPTALLVAACARAPLERAPAAVARLPPPASTRFMMDALPSYAAQVALGAIPAFAWTPELIKPVGLAYFFTLAVSTVYIGCQRQDLDEIAPITSQNAALAPIVAGTSLTLLYALIKFTDINPATVYQFACTAFGIVAWVELLQPLCGLAALSVGGDDVSYAKEDEQRVLGAGAAPAIAIALGIAIVYAQGPESTGGALTLPAFAAINNLLAWAIATSALGVLALESFAAGAALLVGLFCYDAFFVFKSDVMVTVATTIEAPAKFLFTSASATASYPFSVLGLGDIVIPGAFVALMRQFDLDQADPEQGPAAARKGEPLQEFTYFRAAVTAYALGLALTFGANYFTQSGQPALVYIVPSLLAAALGTAATRGDVETLVKYKSARAAEAAAEIAARK